MPSQADPANLFYATAAEGFRLGGGNSSIPATCGDFPQTYKSDTLKSFEVGEKSALFSGRMQLDYSLFHAKWSNIQQLNFINPEGRGQAMGYVRFPSVQRRGQRAERSYERLQPGNW